MLWFRPDAWQMPRESAVSKVVAEAIASGRRSRAIYPVRALHGPRRRWVARARAGEQIRIGLRAAHAADGASARPTP